MHASVGWFTHRATETDMRFLDELPKSEIVCKRCKAHGAPDKCWQCGRNKREA